MCWRGVLGDGYLGVLEINLAPSDHTTSAKLTPQSENAHNLRGMGYASHHTPCQAPRACLSPLP